MADSKIKLFYFDLNGRAEVIRLVLTYAGADFDDIRISRDKWPEIKPTTPFGQVPFAEIQGKNYGQSLALAQYSARENNLYGQSNLDGLKIDQFSQLGEDFYQECGKVFREKDEEKKAELSIKFKEEVVQKYFGIAEKLLEENGGEHLVGDGVTLADFILFDWATGFSSTYIGNVVDQFPNIKALVEKIGSNERIRAYRESHK